VHVELPLFYGKFIFVRNLSKAFPYSSIIILVVSLSPSIGFFFNPVLCVLAALIQEYCGKEDGSSRRKFSI
jgi:hypothetical protein